MKIKPNDISYATFYDLLSSYRVSTLMMVAVNSRLFEVIGAAGKSSHDIAIALEWHEGSTQRFLDCLVKMGFLGHYEAIYYPSLFAKQFLLSDSENSQLSSIQFETSLFANWQHLESVLKTGKRKQTDKTQDEYNDQLQLFISAMDEAAQCRSCELWDSFIPATNGVIAEMGSGSGAYLADFLEKNPGWQGIFCDLEDVVNIAKKTPRLKALAKRIQFVNCNLLDDSFCLSDQVKNNVDIMLYSNLLHCQSESENQGILQRTRSVLSENGFVIIHDFFKDVNWEGALYDLHMMLNTYNGQTYTIAETAALLKHNHLHHTELVQLPSRSAALFAAARSDNLPDTNSYNKLLRKAKELDFYQAIIIDPKTTPVHAWVQEKCRQGCENYGKKPSCPPHSLSYNKMRELLQDYQTAILLVAEPPLKNVQRNLLELEKTAFLDGYSKALAFSSGPCSICDDCLPDKCRFPSKCRSSLEACGVDVFTLANDSGINLVPLKSRQDVVQYVCMLLVE